MCHPQRFLENEDKELPRRPRDKLGLGTTLAGPWVSREISRGQYQSVSDPLPEATDAAAMSVRVSLAREQGLTVLGFVRQDRFNI